MTMHTLKSKMVKQFGKTFEAPDWMDKKADRDHAQQAPESKVDKDWRTARTALDKAECLVHEAKNAKTLKAAIKKMDLAQKHMNVVYRAHEKAGG